MEDTTVCMLIGRDLRVKGKLMIQEKEERIAGIISLSKCVCGGGI